MTSRGGLALVALLLASPAAAFTTEASDNPVWPGATMTYHVNVASFAAGHQQVTAVVNGYLQWQNDSVATIVCNRGADVTGHPNAPGEGTNAGDGRNDVYFETSTF